MANKVTELTGARVMSRRAAAVAHMTILQDTAYHEASLARFMERIHSDDFTIDVGITLMAVGLFGLAFECLLRTIRHRQ